MNWSALTKKQQYMVITTAVLVALQIFLMIHFLGWTKPASARGGSEKELIKLEQQIDDANKVISREETVRTELAQGIEKLEALTAHVPTLSDRYAWAYEYVSRCATQGQIELDNLEEAVFTGDAKKAAAQPYEISASTRCGYQSLVEFLSRLEKGNPLLRIKEVAISTIPDQPLSHQVRIVMQWPASVKIEKGTQ